MANATVNLTLDCGAISLGTNQTWTVASGTTLTTGSTSSRGRVQNNTITKSGLGTLTLGGTDDNASLGLIVNSGTVNLNKVSTSGAHAVGGGGLVINNNNTVKITGTGGDQIYDGGGVCNCRQCHARFKWQ